MLKQHKDILAAVIRDLRRELLGTTDKDGTPVRGDLDRELERLGVLRDGRVQPIDALPRATPAEVRAHEAAERFIEAARRQNRPSAQARAEFVEQAAYSWLNRLVALRALEARRLINGTLRPSEDYGGVSEAIYLLAQITPARVAAPDGGWWEVLDQACAAQAAALPGLFGAADPVLTLRPSIPAMRRCVERIGQGPPFATPADTDTAFADPDAIGWAYQFYQEEAKAVAFASFAAGKKADSRATIAAATQLFTEPYMVKWLLQNSLGRSYHEIYPTSALPASWEYYIRPTDERPLSQPAPTMASLEMLTVLDPCVGSGHFLREAFDLLVVMYREQHPAWEARQVVETILRHHLHGIDIDPRAVQLAALTLYMRALELLRDEARARRRAMPQWTPAQINLATTPSGLDAAALDRHLARHPEDLPLRPVLASVFASLSQSELLGSLLRPAAELDVAIAELQAPQQTSMFDAPTPESGNLARRDPAVLKQLVFNQVAQSFRDEAASPDPADALFGREAERGVRLLQLLDRKYAVVVTNPPYMGSKNMPDLLKKYVEQHYKPGKRDLYAAFILRCLELCAAHGRVAMVTQQSWMFLRSFAELRAVPAERVAEAQRRREFPGLLRATALEGLAHLGPNAFEEISGEVVQAALFTLANSTPPAHHRLHAIRLIGLKSAQEKAHMLRDQSLTVVSRSSQSDFLAIPETPLVYWLGNVFWNIFTSSLLLESKSKALEGLQTGENLKWIRYFWEINEFNFISRKWVPLLKGGGYKKWFGLDKSVVRWDNNGLLLASQSQATLRNSYMYFQLGLSYTDFAIGNLGVRFLRGDEVFDLSAPSVFINDNDFTIEKMAIILNSRISSYMIRLITPNPQHIRTGYLRLLPLPRFITSSGYARSCLHLKRHLVATDPNERSFSGVISDQGHLNAIAAWLHTLEGLNECEVFAAYGVAGEDMAAVLAETGTPAGFHPLLVGYDALPELPKELERPVLPAEVLAYLEQHERIGPSPTEFTRLKARLRTLYEAGPGAKDDSADDESGAGGGDDEEGEAAVAGAHIPIPTETFLEELSVKMELHPISVYWLLEELRAEGVRCKPEERRLLEERLAVLVLRLLGHRWPKQIEAVEPLPEWADADGIIPLVNLGTGEATLTTRLRERLREEDGEIGAQRTEALLVELTGVTSLEDWCVRLFWPRHVKQFKARPVAWHLASRPTGAGKKRGTRQAPLFECMLYYHAIGGDALARLRTQYVEPLLRREESALAEALGKDQTEAAAAANVRVEELRSFLDRLQQVEREGFACAELDALLAQEPLDRWSGDGIIAPASVGELARQERAWRVDLNDGVRVNIAPLQLAGVLAGDVLKAADAKKAIADRARWRADERRWVREGKLPRCGWMEEGVPESLAWTKRAPERAAEQHKLEAKRRAAQAQGILKSD